MKRGFLILIVLFSIVLLFIIFVTSVRFPLGSTDLDYIVRKSGELLSLNFSVLNASRDIGGRIFFEEVSYLPEFYGKLFVSDYDELVNFLSGRTNYFSFSLKSNFINFRELSESMKSLGLSYDEIFNIVTNFLSLYLDKISIESFSNFIEDGKVKDRDLFYRHSDYMISSWLNVSTKISKMELKISEYVDRTKKNMENYFNSFRQSAYIEYIDAFSKGKTSVSADDFVKFLDDVIAKSKGILVEYQKKVDDIYSKLSVLREGYKLAWDQRVEMFKKDPDKYVSRYVSNFPYFLIKKLVNYNFLSIPSDLNLKDSRYGILVSNNIVFVELEGKLFGGGNFKFKGFFSNENLVGEVELGGLRNYSGVDKISAQFRGKLFMDTLGGEYEYTIDLGGKLAKDIVISVVTNYNVVEKVLKELTSENGFISIFIEEENDNLFRSYSEQYKRYELGIIKDVYNVYKEFLVKLEKEKMKLRKFYLN
ncbi:MAG: hypothetical protein ACK4F9_02225 [Brevinematia bacterium]